MSNHSLFESDIQTLVLDFDGTLVDSISAYCDTYRFRYSHKKGYTMPDPDKVNQWDLKDQCPMEKDPGSVFSDSFFFHNLNPFPGAKEFLEKAKKEYDVWICTVGSSENLALKVRWIKEMFNTEQTILIGRADAGMGKRFVYFDKAIIIDDHEENLFTSRIHKKICYGKEYDWNKNWEGLRAGSMEELSNMLLPDLSLTNPAA